MKLQFRSFLSGALVSALAFGTAVSALAITGRTTLEVDPINIQVNGQTFVPTDVNGKEVPVFAYQGTTYAPLRALAEAYGLEVGYDQATNMATVTDPEAPTPAVEPDYSKWTAEDEAAYQEFKALFIDIYKDPSQEGVWKCWFVEDVDFDATIEHAESLGFIQRLATEISNGEPITHIIFGDSASLRIKPYELTPTQHERP